MAERRHPKMELKSLLCHAEDPESRTFDNDDAGEQVSTRPRSLETFHRFPHLAPELRLKIWNTALAEMDQPRVINAFIKPHNREGSITFLNRDWLKQADPVPSLLGTNYEARSLAKAYLASHPSESDETGLLRLPIYPHRDVLFLNGLDLEPLVKNGIAFTKLCQPPSGSDALILPDRVRRGVYDIGPPWGSHFRNLPAAELTFAQKFHTIIMPVRGLIDYWLPEALFPNPMSITSGAGDTFIALVGHYHGRNLQMSDLEFIPDDQVQRVREAAVREIDWSARTRGERVRAQSVLHRDVIAMTAVWNAWWEFRRADGRLSTAAMFGSPPTLRFARVRGEVLTGLTGEEMYFGEE